MHLWTILVNDENQPPRYRMVPIEKEYIRTSILFIHLEESSS